MNDQPLRVVLLTHREIVSVQLSTASVLDLVEDCVDVRVFGQQRLHPVDGRFVPNAS